jgi:outer membrane autotransporter protein
MNNIYKSKWNESTQTWVACSELARGKCKSNSLKIVAAVALALASTSIVAAERPAPDETHTTRTNTNRSYIHDNGRNDAFNEADLNIELIYKGNNLESEGTITQNATKYLKIKTETHYTISGDIVSQNTSSGDKAGELIIANDHGIIKSNITNEGAGDITIDNSFQMHGNITSTEASTGNITINNIANGADVPNDARHKERGITKNITNNGAGNFTIDNKTLLKGTIKNTGIGKITLDNSSKSTGDIINASESDQSYIKVTNHTDTQLDSKINNEKAGKVELINQGKTTGDITNSGYKNSSIEITNEANAILGSNINNTGAGTIALNNSGKSTGNIINDSDSKESQINVTNNTGATLNSTISNTKAGKITLTNKGTTTGDITNSGTQNASIEITNEADAILGSNINNTGAGTIALNNSGKSTGNIINDSDSKDSQINVTNNTGTTLNSTISNKKAGKITLTNKGTTTGDITNSGQLGSLISVTNNNGATLNGKISNTGAGTISLNNSGKSTGNIINDSDSKESQINVTNNTGATLDSTISNKKAGKITLTNNGETIGDITNSGTQNASIEITNEANAILGSNINNTGTGTIALNNSGKSTGNIINDSDSKESQINVTNNTGTTLNSTISNKKAGKITLTNKGTTTGDITNSGTQNASIEITNEADAILGSNINNTGAGTISLNNSGKSTGNIINDSDSKESQINVTNNTGATLDSTISNTKAGKITLTNNGKTIGNITNSGIQNASIEITNEADAILGSNINNTGAGTIALNNSGESTGNIINDSDSKESQINVTNNAGATLGSTISNTKAGTIELTNKGTTTGNITNSGSKNSLIQIINNTGATLSSNVSNTGAGTIKLNNKATFNGNLINTNSGTITAINTGIFTGTTNNSNANGKINLDNQGKWIIAGSSSLSQLTNTGSIIFPQIAEANVKDKNRYNTINIKEYKGTGGSIYVNTYWDNDGTSYADSIFIEKVTEAGTTRVHATGKGDKIIGDAQSSEVKNTTQVINVQSNEPGHRFEGTADISNGAKAAQLVEIKTESGGTAYVWSLTTQDPAEPIQPTPPKEVPIYAEPVSGYVQMPTVNMELGFTTIGTLHERRGENQTYNITGTNNTALANNQQQTWGRVLVKHLDKNGKQRLDTVGNQSVLQIGHDFILDENNKTGTRRHIGAYVSYGHNENDFRDQYRAENGYIVDDHYTGKGRTDAVSVGGYSTFYGNNGGYVDLVGQVSYLRNKYNARSNESVHQNGWGAALSAETGKSFTVYGNNWFVEPQAQLVYQYLSLDDFNDKIRHIDQHNPSALRGRVGMRFGYNGATTDNLPPSSFYGIANIWHDFVNPKSVDIGRDTLKEEYAKTWGEVGVGIQLPITRQSDFYSDVRYEKNFGSAKRKGFKGTIGYKYTWL